MNFQESNYPTPDSDYSFPRLFFDLLFAPGLAADKIQLLIQSNRAEVYIYGIFVLVTALLAQSSVKGNAGEVIWGFGSWLFLTCLIGLFGWLLRPDTQRFDFAQVMLFMAFAQAPLIFLGITHLWEISILKISLLNNLIYLWSICLLSWAISSSLQVSGFKAGTLIAVMILGPFILLIGFLLLLTTFLAFSIKSSNILSLFS
ncbi:MAG: hypothetical protein SFT81_04585 [Candidatus Caenarcaniphilales bacterium]|nr:hypothetical protein [Candidatus Caenarcaniphilales bacterium]